jgi:hypothetical protein
MSNKKKLLDIVRDKIRFKHYSISTEKTYVHWIKHYIFLATKKHVSSTTQNQAFNAILFLYKEVLGIDTSDIIYTHVVSEINKTKLISPLDF